MFIDSFYLFNYIVIIFIFFVFFRVMLEMMANKDKKTAAAWTIWWIFTFSVSTLYLYNYRYNNYYIVRLYMSYAKNFNRFNETTDSSINDKIPTFTK